MKIKTSTIIWPIVVFIWSWFMGVTFVSMGLGSLFPAMNTLAKPFVCPGGQMELTTQDYRVSPVESGTILTWYCTDTQTGTKAELNPFLINFYAGSIDGLLIIAALLIIWYLYKRWETSNESPETRQRVITWVQAIVVIVIIVGITLFNLIPLFRSMTAAAQSPTVADATATSVARMYKELISGKTAALSSTDKPLASWNGIPIMPQATAGQQGGSDRYSFRVPKDTGTISDFYKARLLPLGWEIQDDQMLGLKLSKGQSTLLVTLAPYTDLRSFVVTLVLIP